MQYTVTTPHGIFAVIQSLSYGDLIVAILLSLILLVLGLKTAYDILDREGYI